jgi:hypothetical protein
MRSSPSWTTNDRRIDVERRKELFVGQESMHVFANLQLLELLSRRFEIVRAVILPGFSRCREKTEGSTGERLHCEHEMIESFACCTSLISHLHDVVFSLLSTLTVVRTLWKSFRRVPYAVALWHVHQCMLGRFKQCAWCGDGW